MAYEPQSWDTGTKIPESKLMNIENELASLSNKMDEVSNDDGGFYNGYVESGSVMDYIDANCASIGTYFLRSSSSVTDAPESSTVFSYIIVVHSTTQSTILAFRAGSSSVIYQRKRHSSTWYSWVRLDPGTTDISSLGDTVTEAIKTLKDDTDEKYDKLNTSLTDGSVTKLGTSSVGSGTKPMYLDSGTPAASSSTVGSSSTPVYMNSGTLTACGYSLADLNSALAETNSALNISNIGSSVTMNSSYNGSLDFARYKAGIVFLEVRATPGTSATVVGTIASGYRPNATYYGTVNYGTAADRGLILYASVNSSGEITARASSELSGSPIFTFSYPTA